MATAVAAKKLCVSCGHDVSNDKRMKDANGKYWCLACGLEDSKRKHSPKATCADCRGHYARDLMADVEGQSVCPGCRAARAKAARKSADKAAAPPKPVNNNAFFAIAADKGKLAVALALCALGVALPVIYAMGFWD